MTTPDQSGTTVKASEPMFKVMQWAGQGDPNDPAVFPPASAMAQGATVRWTVDAEGAFGADNWGTYPPGTWFISGPYRGEFPGWAASGAQPLPPSGGPSFGENYTEVSG